MHISIHVITETIATIYSKAIFTCMHGVMQLYVVIFHSYHTHLYIILYIYLLYKAEIMSVCLSVMLVTQLSLHGSMCDLVCVELLSLACEHMLK